MRIITKLSLTLFYYIPRIFYLCFMLFVTFIPFLLSLLYRVRMTYQINKRICMCACDCLSNVQRLSWIFRLSVSMTCRVCRRHVFCIYVKQRTSCWRLTVTFQSHNHSVFCVYMPGLYVTTCSVRIYMHKHWICDRAFRWKFERRWTAHRTGRTHMGLENAAPFNVTKNTNRIKNCDKTVISWFSMGIIFYMKSYNSESSASIDGVSSAPL